jgi:threonylcarbamoyladenosine tRNA methylthiotransferase MtaB
MSEQREKKIATRTIGCRLNQYETEKMAADLAPYGFVRAKDGEPIDLYLINTCTVTHRADSDARYFIRKAARDNPNARIVVAGCFVDKDPQFVAGMEPVDLIVRNEEKSSVASLLPSNFPELFDAEPDKGCSTDVTDFFDHNRAWMKVSDGCNQWCSFCILPTVRGRLRNRPAKEIIDEVNSLVSHGYEEIVLTGIHLGHYKNRKVEPQVKNLASLCRMILAETDLPRLRISSIEPQTVRDDMIDMYANSNGRVCRHWHVPLQSGSSAVLKAMQRPYDQNVYIKRVTEIKNALPNTIIGADVIVGFPGETDKEFDRTRRLAESGLIDYLHVFGYSDRPGTKATGMNGKIDPLIVKKRNAILSRISSKLRQDACDRQVGSTLGVISEHRSEIDGFFWSISDNYVKVKLPSELAGTKKIIDIKITESHDGYVSGQSVG